MYDNMLKYFLVNNIISPTQPTFRPSGTWGKKLPSIIHEIFTFFDNDIEVRRVFLYISKGFDKVWHTGRIGKLYQNELKDKLLCLLMDFLKYCKPIIVLKVQYSSWAMVIEVVIQGSILWPF